MRCKHLKRSGLSRGSSISRRRRNRDLGGIPQSRRMGFEHASGGIGRVRMRAGAMARGKPRRIFVDPSRNIHGIRIVIEADQIVAQDTGRGDRRGWQAAHDGRPGEHTGNPARRDCFAAARRALHEPLKYWRITGQGTRFRAEVVNYADDLVILSRGHAREALAWTRQVMTRLGLTLNEAKTSVRDGRKESFDFLGYSFGPQRFRKDGHWYLGASPSRKSVAREVRGLLRPGRPGPGARPAAADAPCRSSGRQLRL